MENSELFDREKLSAEIHKCYCRYYLKRYGKEYRTKWDYSKLDEETKDADREMADWVIKTFFHAERSQLSELAKNLSLVFKQSAKLYKNPDDVWLEMASYIRGIFYAERSKLVPLDEKKVLDVLYDWQERSLSLNDLKNDLVDTFGQPKYAMSVPTVEEINKVLLESPRHKYNYETKEYDTQAKAIHELITRKLKGLDNGKTI